MNFYTFLQQQVEREDNIGRLAQTLQTMNTTDQERVSGIGAKNEHKIWVNIVVHQLTDMDQIGAFNDAWREYQHATPLA